MSTDNRSDSGPQSRNQQETAPGTAPRETPGYQSSSEDTASRDLRWDELTGEYRMGGHHGSPEGVLHAIASLSGDSHSVVRLASSLYYVFDDTRVVHLADELRHNEHVLALGVVDRNFQVQGIIVRKEFLTRMLQPFARDVYNRETVRALMQEAATVLQHENLISTAERIAPQARWQDIHYYVLVDHDGTFAGIFSSIDMLSYLSRVTQDDIEMARNLQSRIVRERSFLVGSSFEFVAASHAARGVGGDFYAMKQVTDTRWVLAFCDVSGKGVAAAIVTSALWGMLNVYDFSRGLSSFVKDFNRHVMQTFQSEKFITGVFLEYDEVSRRLRFCDMGHSHMLMIRDGRVHKLANAQRNMPVGVMPDIEPSFNTIRPQRGDHLFLLTDGLTEQQDPDGNEYGIARVVKLLEHYADQGVETIADRLRIDFEKFRGERPMRDDVTFALAKFVEQELVL